MRLLVGAEMSSDYRRFTRELRSQDLTRTLQRRLDLRARQVVADLGGQYSFPDSIESYLISQGAWEHVRNLGLDPARVFCHPDLLVEEPFTSLYYRGMNGLSRKEVQEQVRSVDTWEREPETRRRKPRVPAEAARQIAGLYNSFMSSIIENTTNWTLENGYRTMIASIGISFDGSIRNTMGDLPEQRLRRLLLEFVLESGLLVTPAYPDIHSIPTNPERGQYNLAHDFVMVFSSEPDVAFYRSDSLEATVEIKGGIDPAGALERLGAAEKSAQAAIEVNSRCKNFLVAGVITPEMRRRLDQSRLFEKDFLLVELLSNENLQTELFDEIFNHTLRILTSNQ